MRRPSKNRCKTGPAARPKPARTGPLTRAREPRPTTVCAGPLGGGATDDGSRSATELTWPSRLLRVALRIAQLKRWTFDWPGALTKLFALDISARDPESLPLSQTSRLCYGEYIAEFEGLYKKLHRQGFPKEGESLRSAPLDILQQINNCRLFYADYLASLLEATIGGEEGGDAVHAEVMPHMLRLYVHESDLTERRPVTGDEIQCDEGDPPRNKVSGRAKTARRGQGDKLLVEDLIFTDAEIEVASKGDWERCLVAEWVLVEHCLSTGKRKGGYALEDPKRTSRQLFASPFTGLGERLVSMPHLVVLDPGIRGAFPKHQDCLSPGPKSLNPPFEGCYLDAAFRAFRKLISEGQDARFVTPIYYGCLRPARGWLRLRVAHLDFSGDGGPQRVYEYDFWASPLGIKAPARSRYTKPATYGNLDHTQSPTTADATCQAWPLEMLERDLGTLTTRRRQRELEEAGLPAATD